jgi:AcrR family transcriptional regulator
MHAMNMDPSALQPLAAADGTSGKAGTSSSEAPRSDGRVNRSIVTRKKIVDALVVLVHEGHISPTAEQVAARAQVGLRTVFRHFDDMDSLYREISMDLDGLVEPLLQVRLDEPTWQERLLRSIDLRIEIYEHLSPIYVAAQVHRHESKYLAGNLAESTRLQRDLLKRLLPAQVAQQSALLDALDLLLSFDAWIRLRREQGLAKAAARDVMRLGARAVLATLGP